ncbi:hypothetical protein DFH08DRAFT_899947 [Mycena albidolilacea]|uniref:Hydrophobin n=1 Tax=Mycena albidolilacea TaxID=1033008 RepID=A0AAD6Z5T2_9AGAR|nr:hypothetical protein DFH08DRAFT_899947 [Mycena albidolilacea]
MFSKISVIVESALFLLVQTCAVTASPLAPRFSTECCASFGSSNDPNVMTMLGLLGAPIPDPPTFVGITCTPYDGTTPCDGFIFGCNDVYAGGLIAVDCGGLPN